MIRAVGLALLIGSAAIPLSACQARASRVASPAATVPVRIVSAGKIHVFHVEVARTPEQQERGLMFRTKIPAHGGMIFPIDPPRVARFWMKNCPVPQDWLFIRRDGSIARLVENTIPYSLDAIGPDEPVAAVLEIAGGRAAQLGITEAARVDWKP